MTASSGGLREFAVGVLAEAGALVERLEPEGLEALLPAHVQQALQTPDWLRLGFATELPPGAQRVSLESDWLTRLGGLLGERGRHATCVLPMTLPSLPHPERLLEHGLILHNAVYRLSGVRPAWTRYRLLICHYIAISDEKREGIITFGMNLTTGSALDPFVDILLAAVTDDTSTQAATVPSDVELPPDWTVARLHACLTRALPARVDAHLHPFISGMQRRLDRDLAQVFEYYSGLRQESWQRLQRPGADAAREQLRLEAAEREYHAKVADLRQKYALRVTVELSQTLELIMPVQRLTLLVRRRKGERQIAMDWNPLARKLEPPPCEWSYTSEVTRLVCDEALHLVSPPAHAPCAQCGRAYCRICQPRHCPKCGQVGSTTSMT
jgi:hypothetical protein